MENDLISRKALKRQMEAELEKARASGAINKNDMAVRVIKIINNATTIEHAHLCEIQNNIQALFEMGKIEEQTINDAVAYCKKSKVGDYSCLVQTRYGWCCDLCLEDELMDLYSKGVHTINSCCGHGNNLLKTILVVGINSRDKMQEMGYKLLKDCGHDVTMWNSKAITIFDVANAKMDAKEDDHG